MAEVANVGVFVVGGVILILTLSGLIVLEFDWLWERSDATVVVVVVVVVVAVVAGIWLELDASGL